MENPEIVTKYDHLIFDKGNLMEKATTHQTRAGDTVVNKSKTKCKQGQIIN